ncbi:hypothetical protein V2J09_015797 [Rumex salicifolius]
MGENKVKLYGLWGSPYSKRVEIALKMKGVEYEYVDEDLQNKSHELLLYNPVYKKVPVLVHGNKSIAESHVIIEYIDETWDSGTHILPRDPHQRALARFWVGFIDDKGQTQRIGRNTIYLLSKCFYSQLMKSILRTFWLGEEEVIEEVLENMKILDKELKGKRFFGGESVGYVDIAGIFIGYWLGVVEEVLGKVIVSQEAFPWVWKWQQEFVKIEVVKQTLPSRDKLGVFLKARIEATRYKALHHKIVL